LAHHLALSSTAIMQEVLVQFWSGGREYPDPQSFPVLV